MNKKYSKYQKDLLCRKMAPMSVITVNYYYKREGITLKIV